MGTSSSFGGGKGHNPLLPSWLDSGNDAAPPPPLPDSDSNAEDNEKNEDDNGVPDTQSPNESTPDQPIDKRFRDARRQFNSYIKSGGSDKKKLSRAISSYISKTAGGPRIATKRMSSERTTGAFLGNILTQANTRGIREVVKEFKLGDLTNRSTSEVYTALVDVICNPGGDLDDSFSRNAYLDAIVQVSEMGILDLEKPSTETIFIIMECFIANTIYDRLLNAIATKIISLPNNTQTVKNIETQLKEFIRGAVSDALNKSGTSFQSDIMKESIDTLYEHSFAVLQGLAEQEGEE